MISIDIHSVTELRSKSKEILAWARQRPQFIMKNNKMVGVMISPEEYDLHYWDEVFTDELKEKYEEFLKEHERGEVYTLEDLKRLDV